MKSLLRLENWIEQLIEEPFVRLFAGRLLPHEVARHLVRALEDGERIGADGTPEVPGHYRIALSPDDFTALQRHHPDLDVQLAAALQTLAQRMHVRLKQAPGVILQPDASLALHDVRITPTDRLPRAEEQTRDLDAERLTTMLQAENKPHTVAYLIIEGRTFDLEHAQVRIGRALDNDLIVEDQRVSRYHARMHRRYNRYILRDLGSSGGTTVNSFPVQEIVLKAGDLLSLAGYEIIYAEQTIERHEKRRGTQPFPSTVATRAI